jgi:hypothetical protein
MGTPILREPEHRPRGPRSDKWPEIVAFLKANPHEWAYLGEFSAGIAPSIRRGEYGAFLPEGYDGDPKAFMQANYELTVNTVKGSTARRTDVYARYIGG